MLIQKMIIILFINDIENHSKLIKLDVLNYS